MNIVEQIKQIPILEVAQALGIQVKRNKAMCFNGHDRKTPSLSFSPRKNLFHCFGCGIGGSNIDLVMKVFNIDNRSSIAWLRDKFMSRYSYREVSYRNKATAIKKTAIDVTKPDTEVYSTLIKKLTLSDKGKDYLNKRGFTNETLIKFNIKDLTTPKKIFSELIKIYGIKRLRDAGLTRTVERTEGTLDVLIWWYDTILFPFLEDNQITYIQGRRLNSTGPKYLGLRGISKPLYNISVISSLRRNNLLLVCEGIPDVLAAYEMGYPAVGVLGAHSFKNQWVESLLPFDIVIVPDNDIAGTGLAKKIQNRFLSAGKIVQVVRMEDVNDLAELHQRKNQG